MTQASLLHIVSEKLKGVENYHTWSSLMQSALKVQRLWKFVTDDASIQPGPAPAAQAQQADIDRHTAAVATYNDKQSEVYNLIKLQMTPTVAASIPRQQDTDENAKKLWDYLKDRYVSKSLL